MSCYLCEVSFIKKLGKSIPLSTLARDQEWRKSVVERQGAWVPAFMRTGSPISTCPICHTPNSRLAGVVAQVGYLECGDCGHLYCGISPSPEFLKDYYKAGDSAQRKTYLESSDNDKDNRQVEIASEKAHFILKILRACNEGLQDMSALWVDIGSGVGDLLKSARALGFEVQGVEPDGHQVELARKRGVPTISGYISPQEPIPKVVQRAYIITLLNLLEHVANPVEFLRHLTAQNPEGSFLAVEVPRHPSVSSILQLGGYYQTHRHIYPPEHLQIYSERSLNNVLRICGYEPRGIWVFGSDALEIFASVNDSYGNPGRFDDPTDRTRLEELQRSVDNCGMSDNMLVVAEKIGPATT